MPYPFCPSLFIDVTLLVIRAAYPANPFAASTGGENSFFLSLEEWQYPDDNVFQKGLGYPSVLCSG